MIVTEMTDLILVHYIIKEPTTQTEFYVRDSFTSE